MLARLSSAARRGFTSAPLQLELRRFSARRLVSRGGSMKRSVGVSGVAPSACFKRGLAARAGGSGSFVCSECGGSHSKWVGQCATCGAWNTVKEEQRRSPSPFSSSPSSSSSFKSSKGNSSGSAVALQHWVRAAHEPEEPSKLSDVRTQSKVERIVFANWPEVGRVLGGGLVVGSLSLLGGDPGIGKSTLALQLAAEVVSSKPGAEVMYVSGEETLGQLKMRADRLGLFQGAAEHVYLWNESNVEAIVERVIAMKPAALVVDSIQTLYTETSGSALGSVNQVKSCTAALLSLAKTHGISTVLVGHVTKSGDIAGPRVLEHMVDTVLYMEGEPYQDQRILRIIKNRFGTNNDMAVLDMSDGGMVEVSNPSRAFLRSGNDDGDSQPLPGCAVVATLEGSRPMLVEIQALASKHGSPQTPPLRRCNGFDYDRFHLLLAVLNKRAKLKLWNFDVIVNVVGGLRLREPAADLGLAVAVASSYEEVPLPQDAIFIGEVGLSGEVRSVRHLERRVEEAAKLGFKHVVLPAVAKHAMAALRTGRAKVRLHYVKTVADAIKLAGEL